MAALKGRELPENSGIMIAKSKEVRKKLLGDKPIRHEGVLTYSLQRSFGGGPVFDSLRNLVRVGKLSTDWMNHWYPGSSDLIDASYRDFTIEQLLNSLGEMSPDQIHDLQNWENPHDHLREERLSSLEELLKAQ